jgi:serine/threonine protein kinase
MKKMSGQISSHTIELVHKLDDMPPRKLTTILPHKDYNKKDIEDAADLLSKLLTWVPNERISCHDALKHPFFKGVKALKV